MGQGENTRCSIKEKEFVCLKKKGCAGVIWKRNAVLSYILKHLKGLAVCIFYFCPNLTDCIKVIKLWCNEGGVVWFGKIRLEA